MKSILNINIFKYAFFALILTANFSCDETGDTDPGGTSVQDMAGDWYVEFLVNDVDVYGLGYTLLSTYNTASNDGTQMWVDDHSNTWVYKAKVEVNTSAKTFVATNAASSVDGYDVDVTITDGKIVTNGATTTGGHTSDLIEFNVVYSDDPGTVYTVRGYKRTGFPEDEH